MRNPLEWTEADLMQLIHDQEPESLTLDYKASAALQKTDVKKNDLSKDVSAFANSAGGLLAYGILENGHIPTHLDHGLNPEEITKEWLEQVINSRISRRIDGVGIRQIHLTGARDGHVVYVIAIPASVRAPHMASDHRFYKRFNFESVPMEEYEVRDVSRRRVVPDVRFGVTPRNTPIDSSVPVAQLDAYIENVSPASAAFALITFHVSAKNHPNVGGAEMVGETSIESRGELIAVHTYKLEWRGALRLPVMQGARYHVAELNFSGVDHIGTARVFWEVFVPNAEPTRGIFVVSRQNEHLNIMPETEEWTPSQHIHWKI